MKHETHTTLPPTTRTKTWSPRSPTPLDHLITLVSVPSRVRTSSLAVHEPLNLLRTHGSEHLPADQRRPSRRRETSRGTVWIVLCCGVVSLGEGPDRFQYVFQFLELNMDLGVERSFLSCYFHNLSSSHCHCHCHVLIPLLIWSYGKMHEAHQVANLPSNAVKQLRG